MTDLVSFLIALGCDDVMWSEYDADPVAYINASDLSTEDKALMTTAGGATAINQAIVDRSQGNRVEVAGAGNIKFKPTLRR